MYSFLSLFVIIGSCSSTNQYPPSKSFNPKEYFNPYEEHEKLSTPELKVEKKKESTTDNIYVVKIEFAKVKGGRSALYQKVKYPKAAAANKKEGVVQAQIYIDEKGNVQHIKILQSASHSLSRATKKAIYKSEFIPGKKQGKEIKSILRLKVSFKL